MNFKNILVLSTILMCSASSAFAEDDDVEESDSEVAKILEKYKLNAEQNEGAQPLQEGKGKKKKKKKIQHIPAPHPIAPAEATSGHGADKSRYSLFNPTPKNEMREFDSDRPGFTDSARTVDAGHFQFETALLHYTAVPEANTYSLNSMSLAIGLTNSIELQLGFDTYTHQTMNSEDSPSHSISGFGNSAVRLKWNLFGNDSEGLAMALIPAIHIPTQSHGVATDKFEFGLGIPMALELPSQWNISVMPEIERKKNEADNFYHYEFGTGFVLGHQILGDLSGFGQFLSVSSDEPHAQWSASAGMGLTYKITPNVQLDVEVNHGITPAADDFDFSTGIVLRY